MAEDTATITPEQTMEAELAELLGTKKDQAPAPAKAAGSDTEPKLGADKTPVVAPPPATPADKPIGEPETPAEKSILEALDELDKEPEPKPGEQKPQAPALSEEQQTILKAIPDLNTAQQVYGMAQSLHELNTALTEGNYEGALKMFDPGALAGVEEYLYQKYVASGEWVERFVAEKEAEASGQSFTMKKTASLERTVQQLQQQLSQRQQQEQQSTVQQREQASFKAYVDTVNGLFDQLKVPEKDRPWIRHAVNAAVAGDKKLQQEIKGGNLKGIRGAFKTAAKEYFSRDKEIVTQTQDKITQQSQKKAPLAGGAGNVTNESALPDDVRQVKKGEEDGWLDQALNKFKNKIGRK